MPPDEAQRLKILYRYHILDTPAETDFDNLLTLAAQLAGVPAALITLVDSDRQQFLARKGFSVTQTPREAAFCAHTILGKAPLVVSDACRDDRFCNNSLVTGAPHMVFYAGFPLFTPEGFALGSVCVMDTKARSLTGEKLFGLKVLAGR